MFHEFLNASCLSANGEFTLMFNVHRTLLKWLASLKAEISASLSNPFQVPNYIRHLFTALAEVLWPRCRHVLHFKLLALDSEAATDLNSPGSSFVSNQETAV